MALRSIRGWRTMGDRMRGPILLALCLSLAGCSSAAPSARPGDAGPHDAGAEASHDGGGDTEVPADCIIDGQHYEAGAVRATGADSGPVDRCQECDPRADPGHWTQSPLYAECSKDPECSCGVLGGTFECRSWPALPEAEPPIACPP